VLTDAQTNYLNDADGGSGIHTDFLSLVPNVVIDTHYTTRARMGRMVGILAKAVDDSRQTGILAVGLEERTGIIVRDNYATVVGVGSVDFVRQTPDTQLARDARRPLFYTQLQLDRLTEGWRYNLHGGQVEVSAHPASAQLVTYSGDSEHNDGALVIHGSDPTDDGRFERTVAYAPRAYSTEEGTYTTFVKHSLGMVDAHDSDARGAIQESLFRALYDFPSFTGFLVADSGEVSRGSRFPDLAGFARNSEVSYPEAATLVVDGKLVTHRDLSPYASNLDTGSKSLQAAALIGLRLHVLAESEARKVWYNTRAHKVVAPRGP